MASDEQDRAEGLDDDKIGDEFPPDQPLGVDTYGTTAAEERAGEPIVEALAREVPDDSATAMDAGADEMIVTERLDDDERDIVQEREGAVPAEEAALHIEETERLGAE